MQSRDLRDWIRAADALGELKHIDGADRSEERRVGKECLE